MKQKVRTQLHYRWAFIIVNGLYTI